MDCYFCMMFRFIWILTVMIYFSSCYKDDYEPDFTAPSEPSVYEDGIRMGENYTYQVYYDFETGNSYSSMLADWDIAISMAKSGMPYIRLNTGNGWMAAESENQDWASIVDISGVRASDFQIDDPSGDISKMALGNFNEPSDYLDKIFILRKDLFNGRYEYFKIKINSIDGNLYSISQTSIENKEEKRYKFELPTNLDNEYFYAKIGEGINIENQEIEMVGSDWDIVFTRYMRYFPEDDLNYIVTGVLSKEGTRVYLDSTMNYADIERNHIDASLYSDDKNAIGFDWKYIINSHTDYVVRDYYNYFIETNDGNAYKMHFLDFYDEFGKKGSPSFEYRKL